MKYTSAAANKLLRRKEDELGKLEQEEMMKDSFLCAVGEDEEKLRPDYNFEAMQRQMDALQGQIRTIKHAINVFNVNTVVEDPESGTRMTIDQLLVYLPQLTERRNKLDRMSDVLPRERVSHTPNVIDYRIANYDPREAGKAYRQVCDTLARMQMALDKVNSSVEGIEIDDME